MKDFFKNKKNLYILAGALISLVTLVIFIYVKIAAFKDNRNRHQTLVNDPKITESTRNREYLEISRESAAGIFAGRDSLRTDITAPAGDITEATVTGDSRPALVVPGKELPASGSSSSVTPVPASARRKESFAGASKGKAAVADTTVKTALEQQMDQMEAKAAPSYVPRKVAEHKEASKPRVNLTVVKSRKPAVYSTYKDDLTTTYDDVVLFSAKVYGFQKIKTNETVTLRNIETITANGHIIAPGSIFRGVAKMSGNRMSIDVTSAVSREGRYSVKMSVYDNDFVQGIFVKEVSAVQEENTSTAADAAVNIAASAVPFGSTIKSVGKETAKQTARALEKNNKITITLEDGYEVYLAIAKK
ncbi:MAG: conjugative transposon protein TraM [Dysgonamonadaceae bacterium]|jgi:hypothetical protein|nr:conjugative transposon protein TraM [Dysgonamonadaceae bacterium]